MVMIPAETIEMQAAETRDRIADKNLEIKRLRRLLMRCHIYAEDGMGGSASYAMDRLFQINKLTRKFVKE